MTSEHGIIIITIIIINITNIAIAIDIIIINNYYSLSPMQGGEHF